MESYVEEVDFLVNIICENQLVNDDEKFNDIQDYYNKICSEKLKPRDRATHIALIHCKSFEDLAEERTIKEMKKKPLTPDAIRKRKERIIEIIKDSLIEKYGR